MMLGHCNDFKVATSSLASTDWSGQDMPFSNTILSSHTVLEGNDNKHIIQSNAANPYTKTNKNSELQIHKEAPVNRTNTDPSHQLLDYNVETDFAHNITSSRADRNSKRLILDNYLSAELQTGTVISKDALLNLVAGSPKRVLHSEDILKLFNEEDRGIINSTANDDEEDTKQKNITSSNDYPAINDPLSFQQNTVLTNFYGDKPEHYKPNEHLQKVIITKTENENISTNAEIYNEKIILNKDIPEDNTSSNEEPVEITSFSTSDCEAISKEPETINIQKCINISRIIHLKQTVMSTTQTLSVTNAQEIDNHSSVENVKDTTDVGKYKNLPEKEVYVDTDLSFSPNIAADHVQPFHEIITNRKRYEIRSKRSPTVYPSVTSRDSSSSKFPNDKSYLNKGIVMSSNNLMTENARPQEVSRGVLKPPVLQQPDVGRPQTDPDFDILKTKYARAERLSRAFKWLIHFVNIVGQVDSYITERTRSIIRNIARLYDGDDHRGRSRSCD
jgi:hypothetical protein